MFELEWKRVGRKSKDRLSILKALVTKAVYNLDTTRSLITYLESAPTLRRLCGWEFKRDIPHESKFSRVFVDIANTGFCQKIHEHMIITNCSDRVIGNISRDSTAIEAREKLIHKYVTKAKTPKKRGRPKKGEKRPKEKAVVECQFDQSFEENLSGLPTHCNKGNKRNSNGYNSSWKGYTLTVLMVTYQLQRY